MGPRKPLASLGKRHCGELSDGRSDPTSYGPEYYNQRFEELDQKRKPTKRYAKDTEEAIARMQGKWAEDGRPITSQFDLLSIIQVLPVC